MRNYIGKKKRKDKRVYENIEDFIENITSKHLGFSDISV